MNEFDPNSVNPETENKMENHDTTLPETDRPNRQKPGSRSGGSDKYGLIGMILSIVVLIAVGVLYYLHFSQSGQMKPRYAPVPEGTPKSGEIVYINIDTVNVHYKLVDILTNEISAERQRQETSFMNRQKEFEKKYNQFQQNYQANILTPVQIQNTQQQLMEEDEALRYQYEQVMANLQNRQQAALIQIADSLMAASARVNASRNASFVFSYQYGGPLIIGDPTKDITYEVLNELNKYYDKK